jgi:LacI family transcriptional regulator
MKRATQNDVARLAGVSRATVSYILNGRTDGTIRVSDETRQKILDSIKQLQYRVNLNARSLKTQRTQLISILVPDLSNPFYPMLIRGAQKEAHSRGYRLLIVDSFSSEQEERDFLKMSMDRIADGLILASSYLDAEDIRVLLSEGIPSVGVGPLLVGTGIDTISIDQHEAVDALVDHLIARGHNRIAHLSGDMHNINGRIRYDSFIRRVRERGLELDDAWILQGDFLREGVARKVDEWHASLPTGRRPTALFAANDLMAIEAIKSLRRRGVRIPDDMAVCGFDNIPEAEYVEPPLTTVGFDVEVMGRETAKALIARIEETTDDSPKVMGLPFDLLVRKST